ncbi:uncharacterized protein LOC118438899 [Folsomia candida]|uniref:uncharacterized protein LOC118438899 n=1 Tax=Folsomia candida TaxID=158441 RepID=UPI001604A6BC|nr:uncharacterized protein LOC118438899 [Folsomia candida]
MKLTCCCSLGHGALAIGILHIIVNIFYLLRNCLMIYLIIHRPDLTTVLWKIFFFITTSVELISLILGCLMVHGYRVRNHCLIKPWLVWSYFLLAVTIVFLVALALVGIANSRGITVMLSFFAISGSYLALQFYFIIVVTTFMDKLKEEEENLGGGENGLENC